MAKAQSTVMCIDDEQDILTLLENWFEHSLIPRKIIPRHVVTGAQGQDLLTKVKTTPNLFRVHDVIVCDQRCGGVDNFAHLLAAALKEEGINTPVIVYSGEVGYHASDENIFSYVSKEQFANLEIQIDEAIKSRR